jgi:glucose-1-phosphate thymidylyltransferase
MKVIVPMAGRGSRLRPHTLTIPKPLVPVGGKPIVHRLVADIARLCEEPIEQIAFVVGEFGAEVEKELLAVAESLGAKGSIHYQLEALGTAHAVMCASEVLDGPVVVAFADTLFKADFKISAEDQGILWVKQIEDPSAFGVVKLNELGQIIDFVEKPQTFVSDLAMIGIYYFKDGARLRKELQYLLDHEIVKGGEYQLPDALRRLTEDGLTFKPGTVEEWLDCGNKEVTVATNQRVLEHDAAAGRLAQHELDLIDSIIIEPCYIGPNVKITRSIVGPHVSLGEGAQLLDVNISNSIVGNQTKLSKINLTGAMIGAHASYNGRSKDLSLGDYSSIDE